MVNESALKMLYNREWYELLKDIKAIGVIIHDLIALDVSGFISDKQLSLFYGELLKTKKITGADLGITQFDTDCFY